MIVLLALVLAAAPDDGSNASVKLEGELIKPSTWSLADLKAR